MIHLFFIEHSYSGAKTYSDQLMTGLRFRQDVFLSKIVFDDCVDELTIEYISAELELSDIRVIRFPKDISISKPSSIISCCYILLDVIREIENSVVFHCNHYTHVLLARHIKQYLDIKIVTTIHFLENYYYWNELSDLDGKITDTHDEELLLTAESCDLLLCVTNFAAKVLKETNSSNAEKVRVVYNGYSAIESIKYTPSVIDNNTSHINIVFVGRMSYQKGFVILVSAFKKLYNKNKNIRLILIGEDRYNIVAPLLSGYEEVITVTGQLDHESVCRIYAECNIGVVPSKYEQCSYVALEMMYYGLPIVASDIPGLRELIVPEQNGLLFQVQKSFASNGQIDISLNEQSLIEQIERLICDKGLSGSISNNNRRCSDVFFNNKRMATETFDLYKTVCDKRFKDQKEMSTGQ